MIQMNELVTLIDSFCKLKCNLNDPPCINHHCRCKEFFMFASQEFYDGSNIRIIGEKNG